ncbi:Cyclic nucleotide-binding protein [Pseudocohnilembus persalinus]|uniref:Cyclic nucleotide-binding protein n=1 Tax=Pseudocohnilembus persalinus TaxID=266149 RepID=A0A0V0R752_PSEPJ|nr:Cyclic nucleotide-binding protein [Pseudocohnilembus persalinus]|eukprot:KRX10342.1 Cyclic nucleotide-binding protein [Pseudocohnilembus persalinus]
MGLLMEFQQFYRVYFKMEVLENQSKFQSNREELEKEQLQFEQKFNEINEKTEKQSKENASLFKEELDNFLETITQQDLREEIHSLKNEFEQKLQVSQNLIMNLVEQIDAKGIDVNKPKIDLEDFPDLQEIDSDKKDQISKQNCNNIQLNSQNSSPDISQTKLQLNFKNSQNTDNNMKQIQKQLDKYSELFNKISENNYDDDNSIEFLIENIQKPVEVKSLCKYQNFQIGLLDEVASQKKKKRALQFDTLWSLDQFVNQDSLKNYDNDDYDSDFSFSSDIQQENNDKNETEDNQCQIGQMQFYDGTIHQGFYKMGEFVKKNDKNCYHIFFEIWKKQQKISSLDELNLQVIEYLNQNHEKRYENIMQQKLQQEQNYDSIFVSDMLFECIINAISDNDKDYYLQEVQKLYQYNADIKQLMQQMTDNNWKNLVKEVQTIEDMMLLQDDIFNKITNQNLQQSVYFNSYIDNFNDKKNLNYSFHLLNSNYFKQIIRGCEVGIISDPLYFQDKTHENQLKDSQAILILEDYQDYNEYQKKFIKLYNKQNKQKINNFFDYRQQNENKSLVVFSKNTDTFQQFFYFQCKDDVNNYYKEQFPTGLKNVLIVSHNTYNKLVQNLNLDMNKKVNVIWHHDIYTQLKIEQNKFKWQSYKQQNGKELLQNFFNQNYYRQIKKTKDMMNIVDVQFQENSKQSKWGYFQDVNKMAEQGKYQNLVNIYEKHKIKIQQEITDFFDYDTFIENDQQNHIKKQLENFLININFQQHILQCIEFLKEILHYLQGLNHFLSKDKYGNTVYLEIFCNFVYSEKYIDENARELKVQLLYEMKKELKNKFGQTQYLKKYLNCDSTNQIDKKRLQHLQREFIACFLFLTFRIVNRNFLALLIIKKKPEDRMEDEIMILKNWTSQFNFFKELNSKQLNVQTQLHQKCCQKMQYKQVKKGQTVFLAGEPADKFYIILQGKVNVLLPKNQEQITKDQLAQMKQEDQENENIIQLVMLDFKKQQLIKENIKKRQNEALILQKQLQENQQSPQKKNQNIEDEKNHSPNSSDSKMQSNSFNQISETQIQLHDSKLLGIQQQQIPQINSLSDLNNLNLSKSQLDPNNVPKRNYNNKSKQNCKNQQNNCIDIDAQMEQSKGISNFNSRYENYSNLNTSQNKLMQFSSLNRNNLFLEKKMSQSQQVKFTSLQPRIQKKPINLANLDVELIEENQAERDENQNTQQNMETNSRQSRLSQTFKRGVNKAKTVIYIRKPKFENIYLKKQEEERKKKEEEKQKIEQQMAILDLQYKPVKKTKRLSFVSLQSIEQFDSFKKNQKIQLEDKDLLKSTQELEIEIDSDDGKPEKIKSLARLNQKLKEQISHFQNDINFLGTEDIDYEYKDILKLLQEIEQEIISEEQSLTNDEIKNGLGGIKLSELENLDDYIENGILKHKYVITLETGQMFGELGIVMNQPRLATILAQENCGFAILNSSDFKKILQQAQNKKVNDKIDFFQINMLQKARRKQVVTFAQNFDKMKFNKGTVIFQEGQEVDSLIIIKKGTVDVYKQVQEQELKQITQEKTSKLQNIKQFVKDDLQNMRQKNQKKVKIPISTLGSGQTIGDIEIIQQTNSQCTYIASTEKLVVYKLKANLFMNFLKNNPSILQEFNDEAKIKKFWIDAQVENHRKNYQESKNAFDQLLQKQSENIDYKQLRFGQKKSNEDNIKQLVATHISQSQVIRGNQNLNQLNLEKKFNNKHKITEFDQKFNFQQKHDEIEIQKQKDNQQKLNKFSSYNRSLKLNHSPRTLISREKSSQNIQSINLPAKQDKYRKK